MPISRVALALLGGIALPWGEVKEPAGQAPAAVSSRVRELDFVAPASELVSRYHLRLVPLRPPPDGELGLPLGVQSAALPEPRAKGAEAREPAPRGCPLKVRAIIVAEDPDDTFAVVNIDGDSVTVHQGERLVIGQARTDVTAITEKAVLLSRDGEVVRCLFLGN